MPESGLSVRSPPRHNQGRFFAPNAAGPLSSEGGALSCSNPSRPGPWQVSHIRWQDKFDGSWWKTIFL